MRVHLATLALLTLAIGACGGDGDSSGSDGPTSSDTSSTSALPSESAASPSPPPEDTTDTNVYDTVGNRCLFDRWEENEPEHVTFRTGDGVELFGVELGEGPRGIVVLHGTDRTALCNWAAGATWLAEDGYHVLAVDHRCAGFSGCAEATTDIDRDVAAAVKQLRTLGATSVTVVGESRGGGVALAAASKAGANMDAVVALSGAWQAITHSDEVAATAEEAVPDIDVPVLYASSTLDGQVDQAAYRDLAAATARSDYVAVKPHQHGFQLLGTSKRTRFYRNDLLPFLAANAG